MPETEKPSSDVESKVLEVDDYEKYIHPSRVHILNDKPVRILNNFLKM